MSYIVKALRKLEQERRRVTVTKMTLFRGLSERWQSEKPVWRYMLLLSLVVNTGVAVWLLTIFISGGSGNEPRKLNVQATEPSIQVKKETVARPSQNSKSLDVPMKISLEVKPHQRRETQSHGRAQVSGRDTQALSRPRSIKRDDRHTLKAVEHVPHEVLSAHDIEMHERDANSSPNMLIWKDEKGNIHYSGSAGKD